MNTDITTDTHYVAHKPETFKRYKALGCYPSGEIIKENFVYIEAKFNQIASENLDLHAHIQTLEKIIPNLLEKIAHLENLISNLKNPTIN